MKQFGISFLLTLLMSMVGAKALAYSTKMDGIYYNFNGNEASVTCSDNYLDYQGDIIIPETITYNGTLYSVTHIGNSAFCMADITSISIPNSIVEIEESAFALCGHLKSITIPSSVVIIEYGAFQHCSALESMIVDPENKVYDSRNNCNAIIETATNTLCFGCKNTIIPNDVSIIGEIAFLGSGLSNIIIPQSVTSLGSNCFGDCNLKNIILRDSEPIPVGVFFTDEELLNCTVYVPIGSKSAYKDAYYWEDANEIVEYIIFADNNIKTLCIANWDTNHDGELSEAEAAEVTDLGQAFKGKTNITSFKELEYFTGLEVIREQAFDSCSGMTSVIIPNSVTSIEYGAFQGCSGLTSVTIPNSVIFIGESAFGLCNNMETLKLPNELKIIKKATFKGCNSLKSVTIPASVEFIYQEAFANCYGLESVKVLPETPPFLYDNSFSNYNIPLYANETAIGNYQSTSPWSKFTQFLTLGGTEVEVPQCAMPTISYVDGELIFNCETEEVEYVYEITDTDIQKGIGNNIPLRITYNISVYATKTGFDNSDVATATLTWIEVEPKTGNLTTGVNEVQTLPVLIQAVNGVITVKGGDDGMKVEVYGTNGVLAGSARSYNGTATVNTTLQPGTVAIVKVGEKSVKLAIK